MHRLSAGAGARITTSLEKDSDTREIGSLAVWSVSSAKPGNGVELLRDNNTDTYWQSDGMQPHMVSIQFQRKVRLGSGRQACAFPGACRSTS